MDSVDARSTSKIRALPRVAPPATPLIPRSGSYLGLSAVRSSIFVRSHRIPSPVSFFPRVRSSRPPKPLALAPDDVLAQFYSFPSAFQRRPSTHTNAPLSATNPRCSPAPHSAYKPCPLRSHTRTLPTHRIHLISVSPKPERAPEPRQSAAISLPFVCIPFSRLQLEPLLLSGPHRSQPSLCRLKLVNQFRLDHPLSVHLPYSRQRLHNTRPTPYRCHRLVSDFPTAQ